MEENMYRFGVDADTTSAEQKLIRIKDLMDAIDGINKKAGDNYFYSSQKDIDTNVKSMQEVLKLYKDLDRQLNAFKSSQASMGNSNGVKAIDDQLTNLNRKLDETRKKFQQTADSRQTTSTHDRNLIKDQERFNMELSEEIQNLREIKALNRDIQGAQRRVSSRAQNYSSAGRMTFNQQRVLRGDMDALQGSEGLRERNEGRIRDANKRIDQYDNELRQYAKDTNKDDQLRRNEEANLKRLKKATEDYIKALQEANTTIKKSPEINQQANNQLHDTKVDADPTSWKGQIASRAPSIAIALLGSIAGVFGSLYSKGGTANSSMRESTVSIGQRTGQSDFRSVRKQAQEMGLEDGINYKGTDMLDFQETVLGSQGFQDKEALSDSTRVMAEGARAVPVDKEQLNKFMEGAMRDGSVSSSEQIKAMQDAFLGAIEQSGMVGREKEQLDALTSLNAQLFAGRNGNKDELNNLVALQGLLSEKGGRSLQGEKGAEVLGGLDAGFKNAVNDPITKLIYGRGTKYQGYGGQWELEKKLEAGLGDPDNLKTTMQFAETQAGGENASQEAKMWAFKKTASERLGVSLTADNVQGIYDATNGGKDLTDETLKKLAQDYKSTGSDIADKNAKDYADSPEGTADKSEAVTEKQASYLNDMGDLFRKVNSAMGGLPSLLYALAGAVIAATGAMAMSAGMAGLSSVGKGLSKTLFGGAGAETAVAGATGAGAGGFFKSVGNVFKTGKDSGGFLTGAKQAGGFIKDSALFKGSEIAGKAKGLFQGGKTVASSVGETAGLAGETASVAGKTGGLMSKAGGFLGKAGGVLGKVAPWITVGSAVADIATSDDKVKATGRNGGMLAGMWAGAKGGAMLGGMSGNPLIAGAGGILGGIGGAVAGSSIGEGVIDWGREKFAGAKKAVGGFFGGAKDKISNFFGGETAEASDIQQSGLSAGEKDKAGKDGADKKDKANALAESKAVSDKKSQAEKTREKNTMDEKANLSYYSKLLDRIEQLLAKAKSQNGMFGTAGGSSSSGGGSDLDIGETPEYSDWEDAVKKASNQLNANASDAEIQKVLKLIQTESGGKEVIQNDWDINAQNGNPSKGLLQYIQTTFDAYKVKGHDNINSGYDQILAFFNNSNWQKDLKAWEERMASGSTGWGPTGSTRYAMGGKVSSPTQALIGEVSGQSEYVINPKQPTAPRLLQQAMADTRANFSLIGENNSDNLLTAMSGQARSGGTSQTFSTTNDVTVTVNVDGATNNLKQLGEKLGKEVISTLDETIKFYSKELKRV